MENPKTILNQINTNNINTLRGYVYHDLINKLVLQFGVQEMNPFLLWLFKVCKTKNPIIILPIIIAVNDVIRMSKYGSYPKPNMFVVFASLFEVVIEENTEKYTIVLYIDPNSKKFNTLVEFLLKENYGINMLSLYSQKKVMTTGVDIRIHYINFMNDALLTILNLHPSRYGEYIFIKKDESSSIPRIEPNEREKLLTFLKPYTIDLFNKGKLKKQLWMLIEDPFFFENVIFQDVSYKAGKSFLGIKTETKISDFMKLEFEDDAFSLSNRQFIRTYYISNINLDKNKIKINKSSSIIFYLNGNEGKININGIVTWTNTNSNIGDLSFLDVITKLDPTLYFTPKNNQYTDTKLKEQTYATIINSLAIGIIVNNGYCVNGLSEFIIKAIASTHDNLFDTHLLNVIKQLSTIQP